METMDRITAANTASPPGLDLQGLLGRLLDEVEGEAPPDATARGDVFRGDAVDTAPTSVENASGSMSPASPVLPPAQPHASPVAPSPLAALLSHPGLLQALPVLTENLAPLLGSLSKGIGSAPHATRPHGVDRHTALLCAVKPYLSPARREAAEAVIRLCRVWDALDRAGIPLTGLWAGAGGGASSPKEETRNEDTPHGAREGV